MRLKILSSAVDDLHAGRLFYEKQGEAFGEYFLDSLSSDIDSLVLYAGIHQKVFGYHRLLSRRFPYAVYYTLEQDLAVVWRVLDLRRHPGRICQSLNRGRMYPHA
jgi:plasmid stabilization system protein ParE